jgi:ADP-glucose pyrophosphorylase
VGSDCCIGPKTLVEQVIVNDQCVIGPSLEVSNLELEKQHALVSKNPPHPIQSMDDKQHSRHLEYLREVSIYLE